MEYSKIRLLVKETHNQNKRLRLWASPDNEKVWSFLLESGVDLVNTDQIEEFRTFVLKYNFSRD